MVITNPQHLGLDGWRTLVKAAGQYLIDNADRIVENNDHCYAFNIRIQGSASDNIPTLSVEKEYNALELYLKYKETMNV